MLRVSDTQPSQDHSHIRMFLFCVINSDMVEIEEGKYEIDKLCALPSLGRAQHRVSDLDDS